MLSEVGMSDGSRYMQPFRTGNFSDGAFGNIKPVLKISKVFIKGKRWTCSGRGALAVSDSPINAYNAWSDIVSRNKSSEIKLSSGNYESLASKIKSRFMRW